MSKVSRSVLKSIVKECLVEILTEGLSNSQSTLLESRNAGEQSSSARNNPAKNNPANHSLRPSLDHVSFSGEGKQENKRFEKNIKSAVKNLTSDNVLSSILEDTARTTLQEQISAESHSSGLSHAPVDKAAAAVSQNDPASLFGESASKWADLAFAPSIRS
jgi:hypothetical protein|tara:strand:+ start:403 stop:885 length:483 start_codon:yes stop_codon:yes gene_type:complete